LVNKIREECPDFFGEATEGRIIETVKDSIKIEREIMDWIFSAGEIDVVKKSDLLNFMKYRVDDSLRKTGFQPVYNVSTEAFSPMAWFEEEVFANSLDDFFAKRPTDYTKHDKSITASDLF